MFGKILHANDGSDPAFRALALALDIAKQNSAALHVVCVEEVPYMPEHIEEVERRSGSPGAAFMVSCRKRGAWRSNTESRSRPTYRPVIRSAPPSIWRTNWARTFW